MRERIIMTLVVVFGSICIAVVAQHFRPQHDPIIVGLIFFGIMQPFMLSVINYLENGIFWIWGISKKLKKHKKFEKRMKRKNIY